MKVGRPRREETREETDRLEFQRHWRQMKSGRRWEDGGRVH